MQLAYTVPSTIAIPDHLTKTIHPYTKDETTNYKLAIIGIEEFRGNELNAGCEMGPDVIRTFLYQLDSFPAVNIVDVGNIKMGVSYNDSYFALSNSVHELLKAGIIPIILGGDKTLLCAHQKAYNDLHFPFINILHVDERFQIGQAYSEKVDVETYLDHLIYKEPNLIFNYTQLGYQSYFVDPFSIEAIQQLSFEAIRLGEVKADMQEVEPVVRDCDLLAFNISALRQADAPGYYRASPNGFSADEACQIMRYAGLSDRLSSVGFYGFNPNADHRDQTAQLTAQAIWYFIQGVANRKRDYPVVDEKDFNKYIVSSKEIGYDITFLKSKKSDRWWIKLPDDYVKYKSHQLFPCSYKDYELALKDEIPVRWWKAYNKLV